MLQSHCHQEAGHGRGPHAVSTRCCGIADNFGYEPEHWDAPNI